MRKILIIAGSMLLGLPIAQAQSWLSPHFSVPSDTVSPDGRYGVMLPDVEPDEPNKLVDMKTGAVAAVLAGEPGWIGGTSGPSMRWGDMEAKWSADSSTLTWIHPEKWFPASYVVLHLRDGHLAWQTELMRHADREILARTEAAAPMNFAIAKWDNAGDGSAYPEGFTIGVSEPGDKLSLPLTCHVSLTSNPKEDAPVENGVQASLTMTVGPDGSLTYTDFHVTPGPLSDDAAARVKAHAIHVPLVDTDIGKAMHFPSLGSKDGRYAVGWTIQPVEKNQPPVDWSHWDPTNPDKVLRLYDWQCYDNETALKLPYQAVDFVLDTHSSKTVQLPSEFSNWPGKRDGWDMIANWCTVPEGRRYGLIANGGGEIDDGNFWLVTLREEPMRSQDIAPIMRKTVDGLLHERRPEIPLTDFLVSYPLKPNKETVSTNGLVEIPFLADPLVSDEGEFQLSGMVTVRLEDGTVAGISSDQKRLDPFVTNEALRQADSKLNALFQEKIKSMTPTAAQAFKQEERNWITQRDKDASQAVNIMGSGSTPQACESAREKSLLESTKKRIEELRHLAR